MKGEIESIGGLDIHVKESGASFSVGQRQLLCLARAILKSSKVRATATISLQNSLYSLFHIIGHFDFSRYMMFATHLDIEKS
jgi:ABC-type transport system involved in cytochrome bd biosynthesis fused ATPase/permease subunit